MLDFQQKRKLRSIMYHRTTLIVLGLLLLVMLRSTWIVFEKKSETEQEKNASSKHVAELEARDRELKSQITDVQTASGIEAEIHSRFNVVKDKENIVVLVDDSSTSTASSTTSGGFWAGFWSLFGRK